jgi:hypothetical protein
LFVIHQVSLVTCTAMEVYSQVAGEAVSSWQVLLASNTQVNY